MTSNQQTFIELCHMHGTMYGAVEFNNKWDMSPTIQGAYISITR